MVLGIALGLLHGNAVEWLTHKYVLHGLGKRRGSLFRFHWAQHHRIARKNAMLDKTYEEPFWRWKARGKEIAGIAGLALLHLPLIKVAPYFTAAVLFSSGNYLYRHRKAHLDVEWGKKHMPHHYDHHMGPDQDANWCVSYPWFDWILGTRLRSTPATEPAPTKKSTEALAHGSVGSVLAAVGDDRGLGALRHVRRVEVRSVTLDDVAESSENSRQQAVQWCFMDARKDPSG